MDITRNTDFLISLEIIHNKNIFFPAIRYYREKGIWINRIKLNCNMLIYFDLQSMHLMVLDLLICWTVRFKFWHLGWNHFRHFVHLKRSPCSGILHEQSNLIWYLNSSALLRSEGFDGNGENLLFSRHCLRWGLIFSVMYDTSLLLCVKVRGISVTASHHGNNPWNSVFPWLVRIIVWWMKFILFFVHLPNLSFKWM